MRRIILLIAGITCALFVTIAAGGQSAVSRNEAKNGWHLLDPHSDGYRGISLQKAYDLLKGRKSRNIIVAVLDSGIDTSHEDLRKILWRNEKEINGNGVDDDKNGYVDDVYGWNFCGAPDGTNLQRNSYEVARVYHNWKMEFEGKQAGDISADQRFLYEQWLKAADIINRDYQEAKTQMEGVSNFLSALERSSEVIYDSLDVKEFSAKQVKPLMRVGNRAISAAAELWVDLFSKAGDSSLKNTTVIEEVSAYKGQLVARIDRKEKAPEDLRGNLVKDRYADINDKYYGNNNLKGASGDHGTLVAGTIAAVRDNGIGVDGIAGNVRIMAIRVVPGGDEHDKDIALGIRYAVDHGASIINMSFGKPVSPYKQFVDDAVRYAASKGVLLVHGSGNDGKDITRDVFYPNPVFIDGTKATNFLTVGASGDESTGALAAPFSNYSRDAVDLFAPGMNIYTTATDNRYKSADGTSLASPVAAGVAALLKSYFPHLSPAQIIYILKNSGSPVSDEVATPGERDDKLRFSELSSSGRITNAYEAVKMALEMKKESP